MQKEFKPEAEKKEQKTPYSAAPSALNQQPDSNLSNYNAAGKLINKIAIITGGDSGIGRAVAIAFAKEGANITILYSANDDDAEETQRMVEAYSQECLIIKTDVRNKQECFDAVNSTIQRYGSINILINNAAYQQTQERLEDISEEQLRRTFETNFYGYFFMAQAVLPHLNDGDSIINTGSIAGLTGLETLVDYTATKGAIHSFTKSLALQLGKRNIRVNSVLPGAVWTPNIPGTMPAEEFANFGQEATLERSGQPEEIAPAYVLLASNDGSFITGSLLEITG